MHDRFYNDNTFQYYGTDFEINEDPRHEQPKSLAKSVEEITYMDPNNCPWYEPINPVDWTPPTPSLLKNLNFHFNQYSQYQTSLSYILLYFYIFLFYQLIIQIIYYIYSFIFSFFY